MDGLRIYTEYIGPTATYLKLCWYIADVAHRQDILTTGIHLAEKGYIIDKGPTEFTPSNSTTNLNAVPMSNLQLQIPDDGDGQLDVPLLIIGRTNRPHSEEEQLYIRNILLAAESLPYVG